jgi:hypothetical protein
VLSLFDSNTHVRRFAAIFVILLYLYNFAGYLAAFYVLQYRVRSEMKTTIKAGLPETMLAVLVFRTSSLGNDTPPVQWLEEDEFRYAGGMYDVVRSYTSGDSTYFLCINDVQEERLSANLDSHVNREMNATGRTKSLDSLQNLFKDSYQKQSGVTSGLVLLGRVLDPTAGSSLAMIPNAPFHPPRLPATVTCHA